MERLHNTIAEYAWGSKTAIAQLLGQPPSPVPQAELWLGAHPLAPSATSRGTLLSLITSAPAQALGPAIAQRFENRLPFLLKVLAADAPLSLQAHPSLVQARAGFAREEAQGIALTAGHRSYKDANHKPELLCALTRFEALCGFRPLADSARLFEALDEPVLLPSLSALRSGLLRAAFENLMTMGAPEQRALLAPLEKKLVALASGTGPAADAYRWAAALAQAYPGDIGALSSLLLNHVVLQPGQALYLAAGNLHAYLRGLGIELMASSDNVLRGGLTRKHVDVPELLKVLDFSAGPINLLEATEESAAEAVYLTPAPDFALSRLTVQPGAALVPKRRGPEILLCTQGAVSATCGDQSLVVKQGESIWVAAAEPDYSLRGDGTLYRATVGGTFN